MTQMLALVLAGFATPAHATYCYNDSGLTLTNQLQQAVDDTDDGVVLVSGANSDRHTLVANKSIFLIGADPAQPCVEVPGITTASIAMAPMAPPTSLLEVQRSMLVIRDVTVRDGRATDLAAPTAGNGGNIHATDSRLFLLTNAQITNGYAAVQGGGIYADHTELRMQGGGTLVSGNTAEGDGGGIAIHGVEINQIFVHMLHNVEGNTSVGGNGGGVYAFDAPMCLFRTEGNDAVAGHGGGAFFTSADAAQGAESMDPFYWGLGPTLDNHAALDGGGHFVDSGDLYLSTSDITGNRAGQGGGGVRMTGLADVYLQRSLSIADNSAWLQGGGLHADAGASVTLPFELNPLDYRASDLVADIDFPGHVLHIDVDSEACDLNVNGYTGPVAVRDNLAGGDGAGATNALGQGGGISLSGAGLAFDEIDQLTTTLAVTSNEATLHGGGVALRDAAILDGSEGLDRVEVIDNVAADEGGGWSVAGPGTLADLFEAYVDANAATSGSGGGAAVSDGATFEQQSGTLSSNTAGGLGGGIHGDTATIRLGGVAAALGSCVIPAGAVTCVHLDGNTAVDPLGGGAIATEATGGGSTVQADHVLFTNNVADAASVVAILGDADDHDYENLAAVDNYDPAGASPYAVVMDNAGATFDCTQCTIGLNRGGLHNIAGTGTVTNSLVVRNGVPGTLANVLGAFTSTCNSTSSRVDLQDATMAQPGRPTQGRAHVLDLCVDVLPDDIEQNPRTLSDRGAYEM